MNATREELQALLERVEAATGVDLPIDVDLYRLELGPKHAPIVDHWTLHQIETLVPRYTASIDAALALVERVLPDAHLIFESGKASWKTCVIQPAPNSDFTEEKPAPTLPIAIAAALLKALIAQQEEA